MAQILFFPIVKAEDINSYSMSLYIKYKVMSDYDYSDPYNADNYSDPYTLAKPTSIGF